MARPDDPTGGAAPRLPRKPMASARKVTLFRREIREWISPPALEILMGAAEVVTEGAFDPSSPEGPRYLGSVRLRIALPRCAAYLRGPLDASAAHRLVQLLKDDAVSREVLQEIALREAERSAGCRLYGLEVEVATSHRGEELYVDLDVEGRVRPAAVGGGRGTEAA
jgi:hypothetical protein